jgi:2-aminoadipate transaminase
MLLDLPPSDPEDEALLQYGPEQGSETFRTELARFLNRELCASETESTHSCRTFAPETLLLSGGSSMGLEWVVRTFLSKDDCILVERPTYFLALRTFEDCGLRVRGVDVYGVETGEEELAERDDGIVDPFVQRVSESISATRRETGSAPRAIYLIPTFQNPTGRTLSTEARRELISLCDREGILIICDDVYDLLYFGVEHTPPPPLVLLDNTEKGVVLSLGTASKILAPSLRIGWISCGRPEHVPKLLDPLVARGFVQSGGGVATFSSELVTRLLARDPDAVARHLIFLRQGYGVLCKLLCDGIRETFSEDAVRIVGDIDPTGGYFVWCRLGPGAAVQDAQALVERLNEEKCTILTGLECVSATSPLPVGVSEYYSSHFRLSFSYQSPESIRDGLRELKAAIGGS